MHARLLLGLMALVQVSTVSPARAQAKFRPLGVPESIVNGISGNGKIVVGGVNLSEGVASYFRWTELGGAIPIGIGPGACIPGGGNPLKG